MSIVLEMAWGPSPHPHVVAPLPLPTPFPSTILWPFEPPSAINMALLHVNPQYTNKHLRRHFNALEDRREANKLSPTRRERNRESFPRKTIRFCRQNQHPSKRREDKYYTCFWRAFWLNNNEFEQSLELAEGGIHPHLHQDPGHGIGLCPHHHHNCLVVHDHRENYCCLFRLTSSLKRY